jgi:hypothetical protein
MNGAIEDPETAEVEGRAEGRPRGRGGLTRRRELDERTVLFLLTPARPAALKAVITVARSVEKHRSLFCPRYDDCLDHAVVCGWVSWTCADCPLFGTAGGSRGAA